MLNILITGCNGFFGRNLVDQWQHRHTLIGIDNNSSQAQTLEPFNEWHRTVYHCNVAETLPPMIYAKPIDVIIHLAGKTRIPQSWLDPSAYYINNIVGSQNVFEFAQLKEVKKFIYVSSSSVYGDRMARLKESDSLNPTNPYAVSKAAAEMALKAMSVTGKTELIIVRPFTMYGPYMNYGENSLAIAKFINAWLKDLPLSIEGTGEQERDYVHIDDAVRALELVIEHGKNGDIFNIGSGAYRSIQSIADQISAKQVRVPARQGPIRRTWADISKLSNLGFRPEVDFDSWLAVYLENTKTYKEHL